MVPKQQDGLTHAPDCLRVTGVVGCSCGAVQRREWGHYWRYVLNMQGKAQE